MISFLPQVLETCTNSWSNNQKNGSKTESKEQEADDNDNPSSFETLSAKYRPGSGSASGEKYEEESKFFFQCDLEID